MRNRITAAIVIAVMTMGILPQLASGYQPLGSKSLGGPIGDSTPRGSSYMLVDNHGGSWSDAEKSPNNSEDDLMCWAAAASNVLEWTGWGKVGGMSNTDQMFGYFQNHWTDQGGLMEYGWDWWFDGTNPSQGWFGWSQVDVAGGDFHPTENFSNYYYEQSNNSLTMGAVDSYLRAGHGTTLAVYWETGGGHAITCWGYNYNPNDSDDYYGVWVTDSDDDKGDSTPEDELRYYDVEYDALAGKWYLQDFYGYGSQDVFIGSVQALKTPEPATMTVLALGGLALLRRRRK